MSKLKNFKVSELLQDERFVRAARTHCAETEALFQPDSEAFLVAKALVLSVSADDSQITPDETAALWQRLANSAAAAKPDRSPRPVRFGTLEHGTWNILSKAAALIAALLATATLVIYYHAPNKIDPIVKAASELQKTAPQQVELILADSVRIAIPEENAQITYSSKEEIIINDRKIDSHTSAPQQYNTLIVPFGKRSSLTLEDGTKIWLNAGSKVVYPVAFATHSREIFVDGEAYLEVAKDAKRPFTVKTATLQTLVKGTAFNITSYEEDHSSAVVLVCGAVRVSGKNIKPQNLQPNEMLTVSDNKTTLATVNAAIHTAWKDGMYICDNEPVKSIATRLNRYYNADIVVEQQAENLLCSGKLDLKDDLRKVLDVLASTAPVIYEISDKIYIKFNPY